MMYTIQKEIEFDAGHRVPLHASKCKNPHGHRYRVVVHLAGELITEGPETGMVKDFGGVKAILTELVHDVYDHGFIIHQGDHECLKAFGIYYDPEHNEWTYEHSWKVIIVPFIPTAECLARSIYVHVKKELPNLIQVDVWETPTSMASYKED